MCKKRLLRIILLVDLARQLEIMEKMEVRILSLRRRRRFW